MMLSGAIEMIFWKL